MVKREGDTHTDSDSAGSKLAAASTGLVACSSIDGDDSVVDDGIGDGDGDGDDDANEDP